MKLLLIEDDREIASALLQVLAPVYDITHVNNGDAGLEKATKGKFGLIVLDLNLPDIGGLEICQNVRDEGQKTPILILTGQDAVMDKIRLLDAGADDYLTKPFSLGELKARLRSLERRAAGQAGEDAVHLSLDDLILDRRKHTVTRSGEHVALRRKEFALLECLMLHSGTVVSRSILGNYAWQGADKPWTNTIDVHIKHLRDKIDRPFKKQLIQTVHGLGYKAEAPNTPLIASRANL